jgi:hypothetical protein
VFHGVRLLLIRAPESPEIHADSQGRAPRRVNTGREILADLVKREILVKTSQAARGPSVTHGPGARFPQGKTP